MPRRRSEQDTDWTRRYRQGDFDRDDAESVQRFSNRSKFAQEMRIRRTAQLRAADASLSADLDGLPLGEVIQVYSLYLEVAGSDQTYLCVRRRTQHRLADTQVVVGDRVRFRPAGTVHETGMPEAVIEQVMPRETLLARQDSFHAHRTAPIIANAQQILIVAAVLQPRVKWGLIDRMLVAGESGGLRPIVCLNKMDLAGDQPEVLAEADAVLAHYSTLGVQTIRSSAADGKGIDQIASLLQGRVTVLAGHSGVGKSSLIRAVVPELDIRVGQVSSFNEKGRHTTTSARRYSLPLGGAVIDTPGVRHFGLVNVTAESLIRFFPDVENETAPQWRMDSYQRIVESL